MGSKGGWADLARRLVAGDSPLKILRLGLARLVADGYGDWAVARLDADATKAIAYRLPRQLAARLAAQLPVATKDVNKLAGGSYDSRRLGAVAREILRSTGLRSLRIASLRHEKRLLGILVWGTKAGKGRARPSAALERGLVAELGATVGAALDLAGRRRAQAHRMDAHRQLVEDFGCAAVLLRNRRVVAMNRLARDLLRFKKGRRLPASVSTVFQGVSREVAQKLEKGVARTFELALGSGPRRRFMELHATSVGDGEAFLLFRDVSQVLALKKLESMGNLSKTITHEFANYLQVIRAGTSLALADFDDDPSAVRQQIMRVHRVAGRAAELTANLRAYTRITPPKQELVDLVELVEDIAGLVRSWEGDAIRVQLQVDEGLPPICGDPGQLQQVLLNLVLNARDAMSAGGVLSLGVRRADEPARAEIVVADTGSGISPQIRERIFDPFFTTKETGRGSGLGLSVVHDIVEAHGGRVVVTSSVGHGTTVCLSLPRGDASVESRDAGHQGQSQGGSATS